MLLICCALLCVWNGANNNFVDALGRKPSFLCRVPCSRVHDWNLINESLPRAVRKRVSASTKRNSCMCFSRSLDRWSQGKQIYRWTWPVPYSKTKSFNMLVLLFLRACCFMSLFLPGPAETKYLFLIDHGPQTCSGKATVRTRGVSLRKTAKGTEQSPFPCSPQVLGFRMDCPFPMGIGGDNTGWTRFISSFWLITAWVKWDNSPTNVELSVRLKK